MISIVIPLYNKAQSIEQTIRCIQAQSYQDFEIVVVDGWSTDGSLEIIQRLATEDSRIRVLMQQDRHGVTPARNESIAAARSERIAFIDADDCWEPAYLETLVRLMDDYPEAGLWGLNHGTLVGAIKTPDRSLYPGSPVLPAALPIFTSPPALITAPSTTTFSLPTTHSVVRETG